MLTTEEKHTLIDLARLTLDIWVRHERPLTDEEISNFYITPTLKADAGVFVSLHKAGELRGCIGYVKALFPLYHAVMDNTINAACRDPRFAPLTPKELDQIKIEISVLSPLEEVKSLEEIELGKHGLMIQQRTSNGLLLPQVAVEWGWNREEFLAETCLKAGLAPDAWRHGATILRFTAHVFSESHF